MRKVRNKKKDLKKLYVLAIVIVSFMAAGYAILSATLTINGTFGTNTTWNVYIESITKTNSLYTATEVSAPSHTTTTATFNVDLKAPGDQIEYDIVIRNASNIDAYLKTLSCNLQQTNTGLTYSYTGLRQGDRIYAGQSRTMHLTLKIPMSDTTLPAVSTKNLTFTLTYEQYSAENIANLPILRATTSSSTQYLGHSLTKSNVESITILDSKEVPAGALDSWGVATGTDANAIMAYTLDDDSDSKYELYIGGDGGVQANSASSYLFQGFTNVTSITGLNNLYTDNAQHMYGMFYDCSSLTSLDLSSFNTSKISTGNGMAAMFYGCSSLTSLDLSSFDTANARRMDNMFKDCSGLTSLDLSNFNTSNVTDMSYLVRNCSGLTSLDLSSFNTSNVTNMLYMFKGCANLTSLTLGNNFNTTNVNDMRWMFQDCSKLTTTINITTTSATYSSMFSGAATASGAGITVNYTSANSSLVDSMIATKSSGSNVVKGSVIPTS